MSHYPIYIDLKNRAVLLVGAGVVAERKAQSLLKSGARIRVVAQQLSKQFQTWLADDKMDYLGSDFEENMLKEVYLVIAATPDNALNQRIFQASEQQHRLCNVVDVQAYCSYIVPAVVNRHPLQVAISSSGTAPVLARHWKQKIETLLPMHVGTVAQFWGEYRQQVQAAIVKQDQRRYFWEDLLDNSPLDVLLAQNQVVAAHDWFKSHLNEITLRKLNSPKKSIGEVVLVGAGPGDVGLLSIHALQALQAADVVLYDALVSDGVCDLIRKDALKIAVGKRAGAHQVAQDETNQMLVDYAKLGKRVVRLKGGDPFVFGRGGEEAQILAREKIPFRIVPGITAALGATAYAGIPLTHRDCAQTVVFITGHCRPDGHDLDWESLAKPKQTLVIYMGTIKAQSIATELIKHGLSDQTPVAIVSNGTLPIQSTQVGTLHDLPILAKQAPRPALIVIGEVVSLKTELSWFSEAINPINMAGTDSVSSLA